MNNLLIVAAGGHGKVVVEAADAMKKWDKVAFLDDNFQSIVNHHGYQVLGSLDSALEFQDEYKDIFVAVGNNQDRLELMEKYTREGFNIPIIIHPTATVSNTVKINHGIVIMANATVNASVSIGNGSIINTSSSIDHDCVLDDGVHICPGANLAGDVRVGRMCWIGIGAIIIQGIRISEGVTVGAGAVVISDIASDMTVVGNPARPK